MLLRDLAQLLLQKGVLQVLLFTLLQVQGVVLKLLDAVLGLSGSLGHGKLVFMGDHRYKRYEVYLQVHGGVLRI